MSLTGLTRAARAYARAELLIAQIRLKAESQRLALMAFAGVLAVLGLGLVNLGCYRALEAAWGPVWTPLALGLADMVLAGIVLGVAAARKPGAELAMAEELRGLAAQSLDEQLRGGIPGGGLIGAMTGGDAMTARLLVPVLGTVIGLLKKRKAEKG